MRRIRLLSCLAPLFVAACVVVPVGIAPFPLIGPDTLLPVGQSWTIDSALGMPRPAGVVATLSRTPQGIGGGSACNLYFGEAEFGPARLDFRNISSTEMDCPEPAKGFERRVLAALNAADGLSGAPGGSLTLTAGGRPIAQLTAQPTPR